MRERVRTVAAEFAVGDRVCLRECPDPGWIEDCVYEFGRFIYRVTWDDHPRDLGWYREDELMRVADGTDNEGCSSSPDILR